MYIALCRSVMNTIILIDFLGYNIITTEMHLTEYIIQV